MRIEAAGLRTRRPRAAEQIGVLTDAAEQDDDGRGSPYDVTSTRPRPGSLGRRAQGPRMGVAPYRGKSLNFQPRGKSLYEQVREALANGKH